MKPWEEARSAQQQSSTKARRRRDRIAKRKADEPDRVVGHKRKREQREAEAEAKLAAKRKRESDRIDALVDGMVDKMRQAGNVS